VKYFVLSELEEKPEDDSEVMKAKNEIMSYGVVTKILR